MMKPHSFLCGLARQQAELLISVIRFAVALAKSQDHRVNYGVFAFGLHNAVRRWLCTRYPETRANQIRERGRIARAWWLKIVWHSAMR